MSNFQLDVLVQESGTGWVFGPEQSASSKSLGYRGLLVRLDWYGTTTMLTAFMLN